MCLTLALRSKVAGFGHVSPVMTALAWNSSCGGSACCGGVKLMKTITASPASAAMGPGPSTKGPGTSSKPVEPSGPSPCTLCRSNSCSLSTWNDVLTQFGAKIDLSELSALSRDEMVDAIVDRLQQEYQEKEDLVGADIMRQTERIVMLQVIDNQWKDHLLSMDELKQGIGLRAHGQKDPLVEYKKESYDLFTAMTDRIEDETV